MMWVYLGIAVLFTAFHVVRWVRIERLIELPPSTWELPDEPPLVSFLVAAWNAAEDIPSFVSSFERLSYPRKELVLCAGGGDGSYEVASGKASGTVILSQQLPGEGKQRALRKSFPKTRGDIIYLTDIDCRPRDEAVVPMLQRLIAGDVDAVTGSICPLAEQRTSPLPVALWAVERVSVAGAEDMSRGLRGANAALWRSAVVRAGAFAQDAPTGTDYTLAKELVRAGGYIGLVRGSEMPTEFPERLGAYVRKQARWLRNVASLGRRYGESAEVRSVMLTLSIPFGILSLLTLGIWWRLAGFLAALMVVHAILNRLLYAKVSGLDIAPVAAAASFVADATAGFLATFQILTQDRSWS